MKVDKITLALEFPSVEAAAEALVLLQGSPTQIKVQLPDTVVLGGQTAPDVQPTPYIPTTSTSPEKPARKPRADRGQPRGPHKTTGEPAASEPGGGQNSVAPSQPAAPATPTQPQAAAPDVKPATAGVPSVGAAAPAGELTLDDAREALGRINKTSGMGMPACMQHLQEFGINRISLLEKKMFATFIAQADAKIAEHLAAAAK
jgi:hypothetical protein